MCVDAGRERFRFGASAAHLPTSCGRARLVASASPILVTLRSAERVVTRPGVEAPYAAWSRDSRAFHSRGAVLTVPESEGSSASVGRSIQNLSTEIMETPR